MTRRKLCVVCHEHTTEGTWCSECCAAYGRVEGVDPVLWAARRARMYERRRWVRLLKQNYHQDTRVKR